MANGMSDEEERAMYRETRVVREGSPEHKAAAREVGIHLNLTPTTPHKQDDAIRHADWRERAKELGVDPDTVDDYTYYAQLDWKQRQLAVFDHHAPTPEQIQRIQNIRTGAKEFAKVVMRNVKMNAGYPYCFEDYGNLMRLIHEAMMHANKSIVNEVSDGSRS